MCCAEHTYVSTVEAMTVPAAEHLTDLPACDITVFGGTGDLALRKLLPALYHR